MSKRMFLPTLDWELLWKNCRQIDIILDMRRSNGIAEFDMDLELERNRVQMHLVPGATWSNLHFPRNRRLGGLRMEIQVSSYEQPSPTVGIHLIREGVDYQYENNRRWNRSGRRDMSRRPGSENERGRSQPGFSVDLCTRHGLHRDTIRSFAHDTATVHNYTQDTLIL